jgi:hypothetical protein
MALAPPDNVHGRMFFVEFSNPPFTMTDVAVQVDALLVVVAELRALEEVDVEDGPDEVVDEDTDPLI